ncbi:MAG: nitrile hydratase accessory protein [Xanthobacteraceae bacterium]
MNALARRPAAIPELTGQLAYPRKNGEPVFEAPWQSRAFGMVVSLHKDGVFPWDEFKTLLIEEVASGGCAGAPPESTEYYRQWMTAFWRLLIEKKLLDETEMTARMDEFATGIRQDVY